MSRFNSFGMIRTDNRILNDSLSIVEPPSNPRIQINRRSQVRTQKLRKMGGLVKILPNFSRNLGVCHLIHCFHISILISAIIISLVIGDEIARLTRHFEMSSHDPFHSDGYLQHPGRPVREISPNTPTCRSGGTGLTLFQHTT